MRAHFSAAARWPHRRGDREAPELQEEAGSTGLLKQTPSIACEAWDAIIGLCRRPATSHHHFPMPPPARPPAYRRHPLQRNRGHSDNRARAHRRDPDEDTGVRAGGGPNVLDRRVPAEVAMLAVDHDVAAMAETKARGQPKGMQAMTWCAPGGGTGTRTQAMSWRGEEVSRESRQGHPRVTHCAQPVEATGGRGTTVRQPPKFLLPLDDMVCGGGSGVGGCGGAVLDALTPVRVPRQAPRWQWPRS